MNCCTSGLGGNVATVTGFYRGFIHTGFPSDRLCSTLAGTTPRLQVWFRMRVGFDSYTEVPEDVSL